MRQHLRIRCDAGASRHGWHGPLHGFLWFLQLAIAAGVMLAGSPPAFGQSPAGVAALEPQFLPGHILVAPKAGLSLAQFNAVLRGFGATAAGKLRGINVYVVALPAKASEQAVAHALSQHPNIKFAEPDALVHSDFVPNDPYYPNEWHEAKLGASTAWNVSTGSGVTVAILDSGIDSTHPDLAGQLVPGWNFYDNNSNTSDVYGHGTEVAGTVAAIGNNSIGVAGIAFGAKLMPVRVTDTNGWASISALASGLTWAADHGAKVANMSFAVQSYSTILSAAQYFINKGGVVMNSAGNTGTLDTTTASSALVSVSATDSTDTVTSWSSYGPYVDVSAPGAGIWTTTMGGGYSSVSGTSFSSPLTAGVAALMMAANPKLAPSQIVGMLESTAVDLGAAGYDYYYGYGRINAAAAVAAAAQGAASDTTPPTVSIASPTGGTVTGNVSVSVAASDNVGVTHVDLLVNGALLASDTTAPYLFSWNSSALAGTSVSLTARAYDAAGNSASSQTVTVTVASAVTADTTPPTVSIASPTGGTVSSVVAVSVNASDNVGVTRVDLLVNGTLLASDTASPYAFSWDSSSLAGTNATLTSVAYDAAGNSATSSAVTVTVASSTPSPSVTDTTPPVVTIKNPANGSRVSGTVKVDAFATDNVAVASVTLTIDGAIVAVTNASSIAYSWNTRKVSSGSHTISVMAKDTSGNQATTAIQVTK
jgi:thermitase